MADLLVTCQFRHNVYRVGMVHFRTKECIGWAKYQNGVIRLSASLNPSPLARRVEFEKSAVMRKAGLNPLEPYPGNDGAGWLCLHKKCGRIAKTSVSRIQQSHIVCVVCATMAATGLIPLVPYPGSHFPWLSKHACGQEVSPRYNSIQKGHSGHRGCRVRVAHGGFDMSKPGWLYFMEHIEFDLLQIGISNVIKSRLGQHRNYDWTEIEYLGPWEIGGEARAWENALLKTLKLNKAKFAKDAGYKTYKGVTITEAWTRDSFDVTSLKEIMSLVPVKLRATLVEPRGRGHRSVTNRERC